MTAGQKGSDLGRITPVAEARWRAYCEVSWCGWYEGLHPRSGADMLTKAAAIRLARAHVRANFRHTVMLRATIAQRVTSRPV